MRLSLGVLFAVNVLNFYDRQALGALVEPIRREFGLSDTQIGALTTLFTVVYAVVGLPLGRLADTWSRRKLLAIGVAAWTALTAAGGLAGSYAALLVSRLGVGVGEAVCAPAATSWIGDLVPPKRRAAALSFFMLGVPIGSMLSFSISGPVGQAYGWRPAMVLAALPGLVLAPALLMLREPRRGAAETAVAKLSPSLLRIVTLRWIIASGALVNFSLYALSTFLPAFLTRHHGLSIAQSGLWAGIGSGVAGVAGGLAAGAWGDRVARYHAHGRLTTAAIAALVAAPAAALGIASPAGAAAFAILLLMLAYGLLNMYYGLVYAAIQDIVPPARRGAAMALYFMAMYLCGASFGPLLTGWLSDYLAGRALLAGVAAESARAAGLHQAMYVIPALSLVLAAVLWAGSRSMARDLHSPTL
jgi:MFS family permease